MPDMAGGIQDIGVSNMAYTRYCMTCLGWRVVYA